MLSFRFKNKYEKGSSSSLSMRKGIGLLLILLSCLIQERACAFAVDTISPAKQKPNLLFIEIMGNNYRSPVLERFSFLSVNYARSLSVGNFNCEINLGLGTFRSFYFDNSGTTNVVTEPWGISTTIGFLFRKNSRRNGFLTGLSYTSVFARQDYYTDNLQAAYKKTKRFDYQIMPNLSYQFRSKSEHFVVRLSFAPKLSSGVFSNNDGYDWIVLPIWGGISIGGGW